MGGGMVLVLVLVQGVLIFKVTYLPYLLYLSLP